MKNEYLRQKMALLPKKPGCYLWKNSNGDVIYVGKAKNLYNRMHQYFDKNTTYKTQLLVEEIADFSYIIVNNVNESLVLENNLIKKYWPKYNILLKDSSEYPYILITDEVHPRILYTHRYGQIKGKYYGPLADSSFNRYGLYKLLNEISPFKKSGPLQNSSSLYLEMYKANKQSESYDLADVYKQWKKYIDDLFNGKATDLIELMHQRELSSVERLDFEQANRYKELAEALESISKSQIVQLANNQNTDYIAYYEKDGDLAINIFSYWDGKLLSKHNSIHKIYDDVSESLINFLMQYYSVNAIPPKVVVSLSSEELLELSEVFETDFSLPKQNSEAAILQMGLVNAKDYLVNHVLLANKKYDRTIGACEELVKLLNIPSARQIEIFDNSNINLEDPVSGMVCFVNGRPNKKLYRKYHLQPDFKASDYHFMKQVIYRRYERVLKNGAQFPDLIIVDGGKPQVNAALESLTVLGIANEVNLIGLKKDNNHKTDAIVLTNGTEIQLDKKSALYYLLLNMQEEVHQFAISFFRKQHIKSQLTSIFDNIEGLGKIRRKKLLEHYPTIEDIKAVSLSELSQLLPLKIAKLVKEKVEHEK